MRILGSIVLATALLVGGTKLLVDRVDAQIAAATATPTAVVHVPWTQHDRDRVPRFCVVLLRHVAVGRCTWDDHDRDHDVAWKGGW